MADDLSGDVEASASGRGLMRGFTVVVVWSACDLGCSAVIVYSWYSNLSLLNIGDASWVHWYATALETNSG